MTIDWTKVGPAAALGIGGLVFLGPIGLLGAPIGFGLGYLFEKKAPGKGGNPQPVTPHGLVVPVHPPSPFSPPQPQPTPSSPQPTPLPVMPPQTPAAQPVINSAAINMNSALSTHGYKKADMPLYMAFQRVAGLTADGYPGPKTMTALSKALTIANIPMASVKLYPWDSSKGYDGINAPTVQEWIGDPNWSGPPPTVAMAAAAAGAPAAPIAAVDSTGTPTASMVAGAIPVAPNSPIVTNQDVQRALNTLGYAKPPLVADGVIGPLSKTAIMAFQTAKGLAVDGIAGPATKGALQAALSQPTS